MKIIYTVIIFLCFVMQLKAQVAKTADVTAAGSLCTLFSQDESASVTNLTVTGTIDARDFKFIRDSMPSLISVNLSEATITAYSGMEGTWWNNIHYVYPAYELPVHAFYNKVNLLSVTIPSNAISIGEESFRACQGLTAFHIPPSVVSIGNYAFSWCTNIPAIDIPSSVTDIGYGAFHDCYALTSITIPSSVTSIKAETFCACRLLKSVEIPSSVTSIGSGCFSYCPDLTSITIPSSVTSIGSEAFNGCTGLTSIYANPSVIVDLNHSFRVFNKVDTVTCRLVVPYQSKSTYATANQWKDFKIIEENMSGIALDVNHLEFDATDHSYTFEIIANVDWTVSCNQSWLTIDTASGNDNMVVSITIEANPSLYSRRGQITVSSEEKENQIITIIQEGSAKTISITAGNLLSSLTDAERRGITMLTLEGTLDARDFKALRDEMPLLNYLDLSRTTVVAYSGTDGPSPDFSNYLANTIPKYSFNALVDNYSNLSYKDDEIYRKSKFKTIILPSSITAIGRYAFTECYGLTSMIIPEGVTIIKERAFQNCINLTTISLPSSLVMLDEGAFYKCTSLVSVNLPVSLRTIGAVAFMSCEKLKSINIPVTVTSIGSRSFSNCYALTSLSANPSIPVDLRTVNNVFTGINTVSCKLLVPYQSRTRYATAGQWKNFKIIVEAASGIALDVRYLEYDADNHSYTFGISANVAWTAGSSQPWLTVDTPSGTGNHSVTLTIKANPTLLLRHGQIKVWAADTVLQIIDVTQVGMPATFTNTAGGLLSLLTEDELQGISNLTLSGTIDARDFKVLRDNMPSLNTLDLSHTTVVAYTDPGGTFQGVEHARIDYPPDEIPTYAYCNPYNYYINDKLRTIVLPLNLKTVGEDAFENCNTLTSIEIPQGVTEIKRCAFFDCNNLTSVSLPSSLTTIGLEAFYKCISLESIAVPSSVTTINGLAFYECTSLKSIYAYSTTPVVIPEFDLMFKYVNKDSCILYVPGGSKSLYSHAIGWKDFKNIIEMTTSTKDLQQNKLQFTSYPNPFTNKIIIELANPSFREVSVEIYTLSGRKIKTLLQAQKGQKINYTWNGANESGQQMPPGIYLLRVNGQTKKVVKK